MQLLGSHLGISLAETLLIRELEEVEVKVFTLYEMKSAVFMDAFRIRHYLHMLFSKLNNHNTLVEVTGFLEFAKCHCSSRHNTSAINLHNIYRRPTLCYTVRPRHR